MSQHHEVCTDTMISKFNSLLSEEAATRFLERKMTCIAHKIRGYSECVLYDVQYEIKREIWWFYPTEGVTVVKVVLGDLWLINM